MREQLHRFVAHPEDMPWPIAGVWFAAAYAVPIGLVVLIVYWMQGSDPGECLRWEMTRDGYECVADTLHDRSADFDYDPDSARPGR